MRLLDLVHSRLKRGPVHLKAHPGTLQRAVEILGGEVRWPFVASERLCREVDVYRKYGYTVPTIRAISEQRDEITGREIILYGRGEKVPEAFRGMQSS